MPAFPRSHYADENEISTYHAWSRCVQRAFLCGKDPDTGADYNHRREWIESLYEYQAGVFAIDLGNYDILSNHQHTLRRTRPDIVETWSDEEVAWRWKMAWPIWQNHRWQAQPSDEEIRRLLGEPEHLAQVRKNLSSLSWFMARVKEPIAKLANMEMDRTGHFYEGRFKCRRLEDPPAVLACSVYIDVNQIAAGMADSLLNSECSAIRRRMAEWIQQQAQQSLDEFHKQSRPDLKLQLDDVLRLLNCNFLAPISQHGPLILIGDVGADRKIILPDYSPAPLIITGNHAAAVSDNLATELILPDADLPAAAELSAAMAAPPREQQQRMRASDAAPLEAEVSAAIEAAPEVAAEPKEDRSLEAARQRRRLSRSENSSAPPTYEIHRRLKARHRARASDNPILDVPIDQYVELATWSAARILGSSEDMPPRVAALLADVGIRVASWIDTISGFGESFASAVGSVRHLQTFLQRSGRKFLHGMGACHSAFT